MSKWTWDDLPIAERLRLSADYQQRHPNPTIDHRMLVEAANRLDLVTDALDRLATAFHRGDHGAAWVALDGAMDALGIET